MLLLNFLSIHVKTWFIGKDSDAGRDWGQEEKGTTEDAMAGWHHWLEEHEFGWTPGVGDGQGGLSCCDSWVRKGSDTSEQLNWTELNWDECNCAIVWAFFATAFLWDWNENWPFPVLWPLLSFPNLLTYLPGASVRNSAHGKGHEEGGLAYAKAWSSLRKPRSRASNPKTRVCFMLSPTPLTLRGALPHNHFSRRRSKRAAPRQ